MLMFCKLLTTDDEESVEIELKYWASQAAKSGEIVETLGSTQVMQ